MKHKNNEPHSTNCIIFLQSAKPSIFEPKIERMELRKWHLALLASLSGLLLAFSWPTKGFPGLLFIAWVPLFFIEQYFFEHKDRNGNWSLFIWVYLAFFIWNALTTWWIWNSTKVGSIAAIILNSLFMAIVFNLYHITRRKLRQGQQFSWLILFYWPAWEFLHLNWDFSWPWLSLGNGFASHIQWIQWYEYTGILGGTFWVLFSNLLIFILLKNIFARTISPLGISVIGVIIVLWIAIPLVFSFQRYKNYSEQGTTAEVVIVQPNLDPWNEQFEMPVEEVLRRSLDLVLPLIDSSVDFLVAPESAIQENIWQNHPWNAQSIQLLREFVAQHPHLSILIGASTFRKFEPGEPLSSTARKFTDGSGYYDAYNTALVIDTADELGYYHKSKLVPGPEKLPFPKITRPLQEVVLNFGGTTGSLATSSERLVFSHKKIGARFNAAICYESVYGEFMTGFIRNGSQLICVMTNDGWWGNTEGHRQHLTFSSLRAIETRRCVVRAANTGISCFVNQKGDILQPIPYWTQGAIKGQVHLNNELTFYAKYGDYIGRISVLVSIMFLLLTLSYGLMKKGKLKS